MHALLDGIPLDEMNTSMTINATAAWLLALYIVTAEEQGVDAKALQGTTQNDISKEFLARGDLRVPARAVDAADRRHGRLHGRARPALEPGEHLLVPPAEAVATPVQEIAFSLANAMAVLDAVRERVSDTVMPRVFGRISFFVNAGVALRRGAREASRDGHDVGAPRPRPLLRGPTSATCASATAVQVNSLGLTESQPENNVQRIVLEALAVTLGREARAPRDPAAGVERGARAPRARGTSSGRCASSRCCAYETTCSSTPTSSRARR
jgi:(2R)-ethylmalonyl-CoA mutase